MHRLQLTVAGFQLLKCCDAEESSILACAEEGDRRLAQGLEIKGEDTALRSDFACEGEMLFEERHDLGSNGPLDGHDDGHRVSLACSTQPRVTGS